MFLDSSLMNLDISMNVSIKPPTSTADRQAAELAPSGPGEAGRGTNRTVDGIDGSLYEMNMSYLHHMIYCI